LEHPDLFYLRAAEGWLELGNSQEATGELDQIAPPQRMHPEVVCLRWNISVKARRWTDCMDLARALTERYPDNPCGWVALAQTLYFTKRIAEAYEIGIAKSEDIPNCWQLLYDTACYACLLGKKTEAEQFLQLAMAVGDRRTIKLRALSDPDLQMLWTREPMSR
jgi:predicted Zn-dependent protease